jgi:hypothetical protein
MTTVFVCPGGLESATSAERHQAFHLAEIDSPAPYADPDHRGVASREHQARQGS